MLHKLTVNITRNEGIETSNFEKFIKLLISLFFLSFE